MPRSSSPHRDVQLEVAAPIRRCVTVTYDVATGRADPRVLAALARERDASRRWAYIAAPCGPDGSRREIRSHS